MKKTFGCIILLLISLFSFGESKVEIKLQLLTSDLIGEATLVKEPFFDWIKKMNTEVENHLKGEKGNHELIVLASLHKDKEASIQIGAKPAMDKKSIDALMQKFKKLEAPRTKTADYSFAIMAVLNEGCKKKEADYEPAVVFPEEQRINEFTQLGLTEKKVSLQNWAKDEIIPIVSQYETVVDSKFQGVLNMGKILEQQKFKNTDVEDLTAKNPDYWRATLEMSAGNQLIPFSKVCMHIANGEFDKAKRLLRVINLFYDKSSLPAVYHYELSKKLDILIKDLGDQINKGIELHDKGKYAEAVTYYEGLLKSFPNSAWLNYEIYFSKTATSATTEEREAEWNKSKEVIYRCDPMYPMNVQAKSGKEGYLLFRRQEINSLFTSNEKTKKDIINYADIGLDLENYAFSAQLYWLILSYFSKEDYDNRNILAHFLFCLDKLGDKETIKNFNGDFPSEFDKIVQERKKIMESSMFYNAFQKKE